jgi:formylglycine-generating enzyme required for sulfatase activity
MAAVACLVLVLGLLLLGPLQRYTAGRPPLLDCTGQKGVSTEAIRNAQEAWAKHLGRKVEEEIVIAGGVRMKLVLIPAGRFLMGSPKGEKERGTDEEQHEVQISTFYLGTTEVTQQQFRGVMGYNPSYFCNDAREKVGATYHESSKPGGGQEKVKGEDTDSFPVENVSWDEAVEFCRKLTDQSRNLPSGHLYRLPREAEWEYACRGGTSSDQPFHFGNSLSGSQANFDANFPYGDAARQDLLNRTCREGSYPANGFGLRDMHGNVWEWCHDWYGADYYSKSPRQDPSGPSEVSGRVYRGGGWLSVGQSCRSAYRRRIDPSNRDRYLGFRVALVQSGK